MVTQRRGRRSPKAIAASCLALDLSEYEATRNPVFLWEAIAECLHSGLPLPPPVLDYLKRVSARFTKLSRGEIPKKGQIVRALAKTLEFPTGRATGARNPFTHLADTEHELMIAFEVPRAIPRRPYKGRFCVSARRRDPSLEVLPSKEVPAHQSLDGTRVLEKARRHLPAVSQKSQRLS